MKKITLLLLTLVLATLSLSAQNVMYRETFNSGEGNFVAHDILIPEGGSYVWSPGIYDNSGYMKASAYIGGAPQASESWLVSQLVDLSSATTAKLTFEHAAKFQLGNLNEEFTLWINNTGGGAFDTNDWTQISIPTYPAAGDWIWTNSGDIDLTAYTGINNPKIRIAFRYKSTTTAADAWQIRNFLIEGDGTPSEEFDPEKANYEDAEVTYWGESTTPNVYSFQVDLSTKMERNEINAPISEGAMLTFSIYTPKNTSFCGNYTLSTTEEVPGTYSSTYSFFQQYKDGGTSQKVSMFQSGTLNVGYAGEGIYVYSFDVTDYLGGHYVAQITDTLDIVDTEGNDVSSMIDDTNTPTSNDNVNTSEYIVYGNAGQLHITAPAGEILKVWSITGALLHEEITTSSTTVINNIQSDIVLVSIGNQVQKVMLR